MNSLSRRVVLGAGLIGLLIGAGCGTTDGPSVPPIPEGAIPQSLEKTDKLAVGDRLVIVFSGNVNAPREHREQIQEDGSIMPPLLGTNVVAAGKSVGELQTELHAMYVPAFYRHLTVTVHTQDRYFFVGGEVTQPGQKQYLSQMTVVKAVQAAGGVTPFGTLRKVELRRKDGTRAVVDCKKALRDGSKDLPVLPGDIIYVHRRL